MKKNDLNILIVDDDQAILKSLGEAVKRAGYAPVLASSPKEADQMTKVKDVHAAIVDCMLPGMNGIDLVNKLKNGFHKGAPIVLISGIFRDKSYPLEAKKKTGALEFFVKPFEIKDITKLLDSELSKFIDAPKVDIHMLLAQAYASQRDRRKALELVENMTGYDLPLMLSILMDSESSGHLNLVGDDGSLYGISMAKGRVIQADSDETKSITKELLSEHGFITKKELSELEINNVKGDVVKGLINEGLMSPHAISLVKPEQIMKEIKKLVSAKRLQVNFVVDRKIKSDTDGIDLEAFLLELDKDFQNLFPVEWLNKFYKVWSDHPLVLNSVEKGALDVFSFKSFSGMTGLKEDLQKETTIDEFIAGGKYSEESLYRCLHFLAISRSITFSETKKSQNYEDRLQRIKTIEKDLEGKGAIQIFQYFGAGDNPHVDEVARIYKEFAKANHPDTLPSSAPEELIKITHTVFAKVTDAYTVLSDPKRKEEYIDGLKQEEATAQMEAEELMAFGLKKINLGLYTEALNVFESAKKLYSNEFIELHCTWAKLKVNQENPDLEYLDSVTDFLKNIDPTAKKNAIYHLVKGIQRSQMGNLEGAVKDLQKAIDEDNGFMPARRELMALKGKFGKGKSTGGGSLLTADLGSLVGNLFKKKAK